VPRLALGIEYDGSAFAGWQFQSHARSVQGDLQRALAQVADHPVELTAAGRTDAGVHALGQVMSFHGAGDEPENHVLLRSLNALAGEGITIRDVRRAIPGFSARFDAIGREYRYRIVSGSVPPLFLGQVAWWTTKSLDLDAMREGAAYLLGEHDFRSFCVTHSAIGKRTFRRLHSIDIYEEEQLGESHVVVRVRGNAFLHSMVRVIVGTLVDVGAGRRDPSWVAEALAAQARKAAGQTAPAHGLTLWDVTYRDGVWLP
jgi:tRNA pseudouridine38-40 synthase